MKYAGMPMGMWVLSAARAETITRYLFCRSMTCRLLNCTAHHRSDLVNRIALASMHSVLFHGKQFLTELQHFSPAVIGVNVHDNKVAFAVFGKKNRFSGLSAQIGDLVVILADGCGRTNIHSWHNSTPRILIDDSKILIILESNFTTESIEAKNLAERQQSSSVG